MKKKEKIIYVVGIIVLIVTIIIGTSYSLWSITKTQETENVIVVGEYVNSCISVIFEEAIEELRTYPKTDEEGKKTSPLRFTIKNECGYITEYEIHLEVLSTTTMSKEVVKAVLDNNPPKKVNEYTSTESVIKNATAHVLEKNILGIEEERSYDFRKWIDEEASQTEVTDKVFDTKISIVSNEYISETNYAYTGTAQEFTVPYTGYYNIELWGAQGASPNDGKGAYVRGIINLSKDEILYFYVGEGRKKIYNASTFNGGTATGSGVPGGGGTDVRIINGVWNDSMSLRSRLMVASGGGSSQDPSGGALSLGAPAGGLIGNSAGSAGGVQTIGGTGGAGYTSGTFGIAYSGCSGGGGYYTGGGSLCVYGSGSGSSYISGYAGVNSVQETGGTVAQPLHTNNTIHYSGKYFINGSMEAGINTGNGKAKIAYVSSTIPQRTNTKLNNVRYIKSCSSGNSIDSGCNWVEIQAIKDGVNLAKGKTVSGTVEQLGPFPYTNIVDGDISNESRGVNASSDGTLKCITVDLGMVYDLDEIAVWHSTNSGQISKDNTLSIGGTNIGGTTSLSTILHNYPGTTGGVNSSKGRRYTAWD